MRPLHLFVLCSETVVIFLTFDCKYVFIFCCFQSSSVEEAVSQLLAKKDGKQKLVPLQPLLFRCQDQYFVLGDKIAIPVINAGCFTEAVEFLLFCFFCIQCAISITAPLLLLFFGTSSECAAFTPQQCGN